MSKSALLRAVDLRYPSNRYAAGGLLAGVLLARLLGRPWKEALGAGLAGFMGWAMARELDPDHNESAAIALPLALATALVGQPPNPLGSFAALSGVRVLAATVGYAPTTPDLLTLAAGTAAVAFAGEEVAALLPAAGLALSAREHDQFSAPPAAALLGVLALLPPLHTSKNTSPAWADDALCAAALLAALPLTRPETVACHCDQVPAKVSAARVQRARQLAAGALAAGLLRRQTPSLTPLAAAVLSSGVRRLMSKS